MRRILLFAVLTGSIFSQLLAQEVPSEKATQIVSGAERVIIDKNTKKIDFFQLEEEAQKPGKKEFPDFLRKELKISKNFKFIPTREYIDKKGETHVRFRQTLHNIPVEGMEYIGHFKNDKVQRANGVYVKSAVSKSKPAISTAYAFEVALEAVPSEKYLYTTKEMLNTNELVYLVINEEPVLCYKFDIYSSTPLSRQYVYINAKTGALEKQVEQIFHTNRNGIANTQYNGQREITTDSLNGHFRLYEVRNGVKIHTLNLNHNEHYTNPLEITDDDNYWDSTHNNFHHVYDVHFGTEMTYDYYLNTFDLNSYDNLGASLLSYVNYSTNYANAFWDGLRMTYGEGDGVRYYALTSIDIIAHEITHAVTQHSAGLVYAYESGALNESFSDIFGIMVDFYANPETANYELSEMTSVKGKPMRSFTDPKSLGYPDTYQGDNWEFGAFDNGGVHINSSVQNHWFYLLAEGGAGMNDLGNYYSIEGIGKDKAADIAYRNLMVYLLPNSNFEDARTYSIQAAIDLYGECSQEVISVTNAWHAVGVGGVFNESVRADFNLSASYSCSVPAEITLTNTSLNNENIEWYLNNSYIGGDSITTISLTDPGDYSIKLIANGSLACTSTDTLNLINAIKVNNGGNPVTAGCSPDSFYKVNGGISRFNLGGINLNTPGAEVGYEDYTCSFFTDLTAGKYYPVQIQTIYPEDENVYIWLDKNNDGLFDENEKILESLNKKLHLATVKIPEVNHYNTPLRLRVGSEAAEYNLSTSCSESYYGQYEDYTVYIKENTEAPIARFSTSDTITEAFNVISFINESENIVQSYKWLYEGGTPRTSTLEAPNVQYHNNGLYDVTLIVSNAYGEDTLAKKNYINVNQVARTGVHDSTSALTGLLYDSGGKEGNYSNNEDYTYKIQPHCADSIIIKFNNVALEECCDYIRVYDGLPVVGELLWNSLDTPVPDSIVSVSGLASIHFFSDTYILSKGFEATWYTITKKGAEAPNTAIGISDSNPPFNSSVIFTDESEFQPYRWVWSLDDSFYAFTPELNYLFNETGEHNIQLVTENCHSADTASLQFEVQSPPSLLIRSTSYADTLNINDSLIIYIPIENISTNGDLLVKIKDFNGFKDNSPLSTFGTYTSSADNGRFNGIKILIASERENYESLYAELINSGATVDFISETTDAKPENYQYLFVNENSNTLISPEAVNSFVKNGGNLIITGDENTVYLNASIENSGITFTSTDCISGDTYEVVSHEITEKIGTYNIASSSLASLEITEHPVKLITDQEGNIYCSYNNLGRGNILAISNEAFIDLNFQLTGHVILLNNYIEFCLENIPGVINEILTGKLRIPPLSIDTFEVKIKTDEMIGGFYRDEFMIYSNDTANEHTLFTVSLLLNGSSDVSFSSDSLFFSPSYVNYPSSQFLYIENMGTDSLFIDSIRLQQNLFEIPDTNFRIPVGGKINFEVKITPESPIDYIDTLKVYTNIDSDSVYFIILVAQAEYSPKILTTADAVTETLTASDSSAHIITLENVGSADLIIDSVFFSTAWEDTATEELILEDINILNYETGITQKFLQKVEHLGGTYTYSELLSKELLDTIHVLIIDDKAALLPEEINLVRNYVHQGGGLLLTGDNGEDLLNQLSAGTGISFNDSGLCESGYTTSLANHSVFDGISEVLIHSAGSVIELDLTANVSPQELVTDEFGNIYAAAGRYEDGRIIAIADRVLSIDLETYFNFETRCIEWLSRNKHWLSLEKFSSDTLSNGGSKAITIKMNADYLKTGEYTKNIVVINNDPDNLMYTIPVALSVEGISSISTPETTIDFDTTYSGSSATQIIPIYNYGTENLELYSIVSSNESFSLEIADSTVHPNKMTEATVIFTPQSEGAYEGTISISSNAYKSEIFNIYVQGYSELPPKISVEPGNIAEHLNINESVVRSVITGNFEGANELNYKVAIRETTKGVLSTEAYLELVLNRLSEGADKLTQNIPNSFNFIHGEQGILIFNGGEDMFNAGNKINLNKSGSYLLYSNEILTEYVAQDFNANYFTLKKEGVFILSGILEQSSSFTVEGELGLLPGNYERFEFETSRGGKSYKGFAARMYNSYTPSVNHLVIVENAGKVEQQLIVKSTTYDHTVSNLEGTTNIHFLLFAGEHGARMDDSVFVTLMNEYINMIHPAPKWASLNITGGIIQQGEAHNLPLTLSSNNLTDNVYRAQIDFTSNDPTQPVVELPVELTVGEGSSGIIDTPVPESDINISVFPNPVVDYLNITTEGADVISSIILYDMTGRLVDIPESKKSEQGITLDLSGCSAGTYTLHLQLKHGEKAYSIIKK
jgi:Zn-dependent metalloprotease/PKD repeat protein